MNLVSILRRFSFLSDRRRLELYPPFWCMRIKVLEIGDGGRRVRIRLPLNARSRNMSGNMFGGSQASLADPIAALACVRLFPGYSVWTRTLQLDFIHEGTTDLELRFEFDPTLEADIRTELKERGRSTPCFEYGYHLADGTLCTRVHCTVAIRPKGYKKVTGGAD